MTSSLVLSLLLLFAPSVRAQSIVGQLGTLLTEQRSAPIFVPDVQAAVATATTVAGLFSTELSNLPLASSSGGFVYRLDPGLGVVSRVSDAFGPFFTERVLRNSKGQWSIGDFSVDTLELELDTRSATVFTSYGITDRLVLAGAVPIVRVHFRGERNRTVSGVTALQSSQSGAATGLGDISLQGRYLVLGSPIRGFSVGADLRMPTGRDEDLLGAGDTAARAVAIGSWEEGRLAVHANTGAGVGGVSREYFWSFATTLAATSQVTVVGEVMGRRLSELSLVQDVYQPHPLVPGVETMRWLPGERGIHSTFLAAGAKWNVARSWLLNTNLLIRLTDAGLRARVTPAVSIDYSFER
jgi:hypothetical protein